jgi:PAS domain S-box-containing protein
MKRELEDKNYDLEISQSELEKAMEALRKAHDKLESRVEKRTAELVKTNEQLTWEIEERRRAEEALRENEQLLRATLDSTADGILAVNEAGQVTLANTLFGEMWRIPKDVIKTRDDSRLLNYVLDQLKEPQAFLSKVQELYGSSKEDFDTLLFKDGRVFERFSRPLTQDKEILGRVWSFRDITERKRAETALKATHDQSVVYARDLRKEMVERAKADEVSRKLETQLQQAQRMEAIGTLAGGIAHDFNNLLMGIQGNVSLMDMDMDSTHPYYERLKTIEKQVQSGARLTSQLLGYARKGKYEVKPVNLNQLVEETSEAFGRTRKDIAIHRDFTEDLFSIEADSGQIEQVLWNLFVNAADAMSAGGDLILRTFHVTHSDMQESLYDPMPGDYVLLTVTDTGSGMYKKTIERVFDPFFTTKKRGHGTGLGLASAYGIIRGHDGYIDVESKRGKGTTFSIYLPASRKKVRREIVKARQRITKGTGTVLLVEDEDVVLEVGRDLLEAMGYRVLTAKDGKEAIEVYRKNKDEIDIIVLDMVMPNMGGGEAYDHIKKISPDVKVLLSSGYSINGEATEILKRGCNGFIQKPFNIQELSGKIRGILEKG